MTISPLFDDVTCPGCRARLAECPVNEHGFPLAWERFDVGASQSHGMGHDLRYSSDGRTALCVADRLR